LAVTRGNGGSEGYKLDASTASNFTGVLFSSNTTDVNQSTLTVTGLGSFTTYYFRVGGTNWNNVNNYLSAGSTRTLAGAPPVNPIISAVYITSITASWTLVSSTMGYKVDASTASNFTGTLFSSITTSTQSAVLSPQSLSANTTYYLRVGAVYPGTTSYANTVPSSLSTLTNLVSAVQIYQVFGTSVTLNWAGLGAGNAEGYQLQASTASDFSGAQFSSSTPDVNKSTLTLTGLSGSTTYICGWEA